MAAGRWPAPRLVEVRNLSALSAEVENRPTCFALIEVTPANLAQALAWLADARARFPQCRFATLIDIPALLLSGATGSASAPAGRQNALSEPVAPSCMPEIAEALFEAGATEVATSPRYLQHVLRAARRHWAAMKRSATPSANQLALVEWAQSFLPWQER
jgi:hypothetical protein